MNRLVKEMLLACRKLLLFIETRSDKTFLAADVPMSKMISHQKWQKYLSEIGNKPGMRILEIGSREVTGESNARKEFSKAEYVGFDYYPGTNVDVVGDVHKLSSYFDEKDKFDIITQALVLNILRCPGLLLLKLQNC